MAAPGDTGSSGGGMTGELLVDPDGSIRSADAGASELFGTAAPGGRSLREANIHDFVCEPSEMELAEHLATACGIGRPNASEMLLQRTDGQTFWARVRSELVAETRDEVLVRLELETIDDPMSDIERLFASETSDVFGGAPPRRTRVMLVDDQVAALAEMTFMLEALGNQVMGFSDAKLCLEEFSLRPDHYDAIIVDASLPPLDGLALSRALLEVRPEAPILLVAREGRGDDVDTADAIRIGVDHVLAKPLDEEELAQWLRGVTPGAG